MISLSGSTRAEAGSSFCVTATNYGSGLTAKAFVGGQSIPVTVTQNAVTHTATICIKVPKGAKGGIEILVADATNPDHVSHNALIRN